MFGPKMLNDFREIYTSPRETCLTLNTLLVWPSTKPVQWAKTGRGGRACKAPHVRALPATGAEASPYQLCSVDTARERLALESRNYNAVEMRAITTALLPPSSSSSPCSHLPHHHSLHNQSACAWCRPNPCTGGDDSIRLPFESTTYNWPQNKSSSPIPFDSTVRACPLLLRLYGSYTRNTSFKQVQQTDASNPTSITQKWKKSNVEWWKNKVMNPTPDTCTHG